MKTLATILGLFGVLALGLGPALAAAPGVKIQSKDGLGKYLADHEGKTLYWFSKDSPGKSACAGPCVEKWPLFSADKVAAPPELKAEDFGSITREDGKKQTTFKGYPLYYWVNDKQPGDTSGQGVNNVWYVVDPGTFPPK
ncbi:MAG: hypothetical protein BWK76_21530 [Desulfobulbaceae bacterium A2]|nr:MAG: hypothetical protein BWK76_21530 [Desulfobulbaceae bacterium A2]